MEANTNFKERVEWIDVAKGIGMYLIYLGHYADPACLSYPFVYFFHVHCYYFLTGCVSVYNRRNTIETILNRIRTILVPFFVFGALTIFLDVVLTNSSEKVEENLKILLLGATRNQFPSAALWFLTGLFCVELLFSLLKKLPSKWLMLLLALVVAVVQQFVISKHLGYPALYYNIDSAFHYLFFYVLGHCLFLPINNFLKSTDRACMILKYVSGFASFLFCVLLFLGKIMQVPFSGINGPLDYVCYMVRALICIWFFILISYSLRSSIRLRHIGQNSLYLCASEYYIRQLTAVFIAMIGGKLLVTNPLQAYLGTGILIILSMHFLVPAEKALLKVFLPENSKK